MSEGKKSLSGVELIVVERQRQLDEEGYSSAHDDHHKSGELAWAAVCYAAPSGVYRADIGVLGAHFDDPWPWQYAEDRRKHFASSIPIETIPVLNRVDLLTKAGALIAAELDRLLRQMAQR